MNQPNENNENLTALEIDVAQWRRDIRTFVETTFDELFEVNEQLASRFSASADDKPSLMLTGRFTRKARKNQRPAERSSDAVSNPASDRSRSDASRAENTLSDLKQRIASRISKENEEAS